MRPTVDMPLDGDGGAEGKKERNIDAEVVG